MLGAIAWGQSTDPATSQAAPGAKEKQWKDRAEYDLFEAIRKETSPQKRLELLNSWKEKYPTTEFIKERLTLYIGAYQQLNQGQKIVDTAKEVLAIDPKDLTALYWITLMSPNLSATPSPDVLEEGTKAANSLLANLDTKPAALSDADWDKAKKDFQTLAHATLGWVATQKKDFEGAEKEYKTSLALNPAGGTTTYALGTAVLSQKKAETQSEAIFYFARAAGLLNTKDVSDYVEKIYTQYHGSKEKLDTVLATAKANPVMPVGFHVESAVEKRNKEIEEQNKLDAANPSLKLWKELRGALTAADGNSYFETNMKDAEIPMEFTGKLIKTEPAVRPKVLVLAVQDPAVADATLKFEAALPGKMEPGAEIKFKGVAKSYTKDPFMVTFEVEKAKLTGWTPTAAPPVKRPPARRRATKK